MSPFITHVKARQVICLLYFGKDINARVINGNLENLKNIASLILTSRTNSCQSQSVERVA